MAVFAQLVGRVGKREHHLTAWQFLRSWWVEWVEWVGWVEWVSADIIYLHSRAENKAASTRTNTQITTHSTHEYP